MSTRPGIIGNRSGGRILCLAVALVASFARADDAGSRDWPCTRCPSAEGWELDVEGGPAWVSDDAFPFGNYNGLDEKGTYFFGDALGRYRDRDANYFAFEGHTRSPDASMLFLEGGKQGLYELRASYQSIPRRFFNTTVTPYRGNGTDRLNLPTSWVRAPTTQQMSALDDTAARVTIGRDWDVYGLGFDLDFSRRWTVRADYTRREREGQNRSAGSFFFNAAELAAPVDYSTDELELALNYAADRWHASLSYFGSVFDNGNESLTWDNAYTGAPGADSGQLALPPDNESHQVSVAGSVLLPARTTLNGQLSFGHLTQNADLLPYTTNTLLPTNPLPVSSTDAEVDTLNLNLRAVSSPWRRVTLEGELRYNDFDNKTPINEYDYIVTDTAPASIPVTNTAYDYERRDIKLRGEYRLPAGIKIHAGFDNERFERNFQERTRTTTNRLWARVRTRVGRSADLDFRLFAEDRDGSTYESLDNPAAPQNPLMRKYNLADRERSGFKLRGTVFGSGRADFGLEFEYSEDEYDNSAIGLTGSDYLRVGADFSYAFAKAASAYASLYNEQIETDQQNSQSFSQPDWTATTDDTFTTATLGVTWPELFGPVGADLEYTWSRSIGEIRNDTRGLPGSFPDLRTRRENIRLGLDYPYSESLTFGLDYFFEDFSSSDWALDGVAPDTIPNLLAFSAGAWNYDVNVVYLSVEYRLKTF